MLTRSRLMSRQEHLVMVQSFVGNAADMNEFLIASYKGSTHHCGFNILCYYILSSFRSIWIQIYVICSLAMGIITILFFLYFRAGIQGLSDLTTSTPWIPTSEDDFMESIKYEPKRRKSVIVKAMHFLKRKYCQFDEFIIPLLLNDIPLLAGRCVIFHLESAKKASKDPQTRLYFKYYTNDWRVRTSNHVRNLVTVHIILELQTSDTLLNSWMVEFCYTCVIVCKNERFFQNFAILRTV